MRRNSDCLLKATVMVAGTLFLTSSAHSSADLSHANAVRIIVSADEGAKQKASGQVVKISGRTMVLESKGLKREFHVLPNAKITRNLLQVELKAILPGDSAVVSFVKGKATDKLVAVAISASAKK